MKLTLLVTEECNLSCNYCFCKEHSKGVIKYSVAKDILLRELSVVEPQEIVNILFIGGEPFIAIDVIINITSFLSRNYPDHKFNYNIVTNGTLLSDKIKEWIKKEERNLIITLSLDGNESSQNLQRIASFRKIDIDYFSNLTCCNFVNMVITPSTLPSLYENIKYIESYGFFPKAILADGVSWECKNIEQIFKEQLNLLAAYYFDKIDSHPVAFLTSALANIPNKIITNCNAGKNSFTYGKDGEKFACHRYTPYYNSGNKKINESNINMNLTRGINNDCKECIAFPICNSCPASIDSIEFSSNEAYVKCRLKKIIFTASAVFQLNLIRKHKEHKYYRVLQNNNLYDVVEGCKEVLTKIKI